MITGYNTDVRHNDVVFHVQTEDKGAANPSIESLVYVGGQVLASKRASYAELVAQGKDDKAIIALMDHQHRTMIAAIRHGKFDEKLLSLNAARQTGRSTGAHPSLVTPPAPVATVAPADPQATLAPPLPSLPPMSPMPPMPPIPSVAPALPPTPAPVAPPPPPAARPQGSLLAASKVAERSLDQVILEYLTSEADQDQLLLMLEGEPQLILGQPAAVALRASSSKSGLPISGAQVSIKMISTVSEPRMLATGRTDDEGTLELLFDVPQLTRGTAALIITAVAAIGRAELKQLL
jgi:hypothetical protein